MVSMMKSIKSGQKNNRVLKFDNLIPTLKYLQKYFFENSEKAQSFNL